MRLFEIELGDGQVVYFNNVTFKFSKNYHDVLGKQNLKIPNLDDAGNIYPNNPKTIKIFLGTGCNLRCKYCRQQEHDVNRLHRKFTPVHRKTLDAIKRNVSGENLMRIEFWGGEPFYYREVMVRMMEDLEKHYSNKLQVHITTNGTLLDKDLYDWIVERPFIYKLSHDGHGQRLRMVDPLADKKLAELHCLLYAVAMKNPDRTDSRFFINSVLTDVSPLPYKSVVLFRTVFGADVQIRKFEPVIPYHGSIDRYTIGSEEWELSLKDEILKRNIVKNIVEYQEQWDNYCIRVKDENYCWDGLNKCHAVQKESLTVDALTGNIYPCQVFDSSNFSTPLGTIRDLSSVKRMVPNLPVDRKFNRSEGNYPRLCEYCPVVTMCRGVCGYLADNDMLTRNCHVRYHTYMAMFKAYWQHYTGAGAIKEIRPSAKLLLS